MSENKTEILNCPFCNGTATLHTFHYTDYKIYKVKCKDCEAESVTNQHSAYVIRQWNKRAESATLTSHRQREDANKETKTLECFRCDTLLTVEKSVVMKICENCFQEIYAANALRERMRELIDWLKGEIKDASHPADLSHGFVENLKERIKNNE